MHSCSSNSLISGTDTLLDFEFDHNHNHNQSQKEFEVIMDALRLGGTSQSNVVGNGTCSDSCGQAAMMSENGGVFHSLVASLETWNSDFDHTTQINQTGKTISHIFYA